MKNMIAMALAAAALSASSAYAGTDDTLLAKCMFRESMSVSFGYSFIYTMRGTIEEFALNGPERLYAVKGNAQVAIDKTASTNFPGSHIGDTEANFEATPNGGKVMADIGSLAPNGTLNFRILIFPGETNGQYAAYKTVDGGQGLSGSCYVDPRLTKNL